MQIREQGQQVQLIRSPYDPAKKRCVQKVIHTFKKSYDYKSDDINKYLSDEQVNDLSDAERKTLSDWLKAKTDKAAAEARHYYVLMAEDHIIRLSDAIATDVVTAEKAAAIWSAMDALGKVLKKAGHPRSAALAQKAQPPAQPGQAGLDLDAALPPLAGSSDPSEAPGHS